jgi:uncharacterized protein YycO
MQWDYYRAGFEQAALDFALGCVSISDRRSHPEYVSGYHDGARYCSQLAREALASKIGRGIYEKKL